MTDKEIIILGKKEKCNILFECKNIEEFIAFNMFKQGIKITPENAPVGDFEIKIIANTEIPYGFSCIYKRNLKIDNWEYIGFGNSVASSVVTALLKELSKKTVECENIKEELEILQNNFDSCSRENEEYTDELELRIKELEEKYNEKINENNQLKAQVKTFSNLMNVYKDISKGRQDSKIVIDYINKLERKLEIAEKALNEYTNLYDYDSEGEETYYGADAKKALEKMKEIQ